MSYIEHQLVIRARRIIRECEEYQQSSESDFSKAEQQRFAYQELKELLLAESEDNEDIPMEYFESGGC